MDKKIVVCLGYQYFTMPVQIAQHLVVALADGQVRSVDMKYTGTGDNRIVDKGPAQFTLGLYEEYQEPVVEDANAQR